MSDAMNWDPRTISKSIKEHRVQKRQTIEMSLVSTHIISGTRIKDPRSKKKREVGGTLFDVEEDQLTQQ